jgi:alpha-amylase
MKNKTIFQFFDWYVNPEEGLWNKLAAEAAMLVEAGITAVWLPPAYKGTKGKNSEGYDVYDIYDLGEFDQKGSVATKYGTKKEYIAAVKTAQQAGLDVYADIVLNHMGGADERERITVRKVNEENRLEFIGDKTEIVAYTKFTFPGRAGKYSNFVWDHACFTGVDYAEDKNEHAIFSIINEYGEGWEPLVHNEKGNFDFLILNDVEFRNPYVREELKKWIKWYYNTVPFDGVRLDAVKHINPSFFIEWIDFVKKEINDQLFILGEYWLSDDLPVLLKYLDAVGNRMSLFDAPLHHNLSQASILADKYDLRRIFDETLINTTPELAVTFVDNHDTQPLQSLEEFTEQWFKPHAYTLILLREKGYPCIFYPDLFGTNYCGKNKQGEHCDIEIPPLKELRALLKARRDFAYGKQTDYFDDANCIGWIRAGVDEIKNSGCIVLLSNGKPNCKKMFAGKASAGKIFTDLLKLQNDVLIDEDGMGTFTVNERSVGVWVVKRQTS